ncbi:unnamed protein product [Candidula unifasciata]|uniref:Glutaminyl-peptide cyclotransferase n=1 Tax=Candidula unifasciata TaxID=100452 RepID=A0A8S4A1M1_9EUPU|nr:unnamed protein product [Candidula unifasciata]
MSFATNCTDCPLICCIDRLCALVTVVCILTRSHLKYTVHACFISAALIIIFLTVQRNLQWTASEPVLRFWSQDLSDMDNFKTSVLRPFMVQRVPGTDGNRAVQNHIKSFLKSWRVEEDTFVDSTPYGKKKFTNIIATLDPSKPNKIVLACHYDSKNFSNYLFIGATDSAVPCGILLQTSKQLQCFLEKSRPNDLTLQLIFFDGEEAFVEWTGTDSLYGSRHLAARWSSESDPVFNNMTRLDAIREFILLDLIGTSDTTIPQQFKSTSEIYQVLVNTERLLRTKGYLTGNHTGPIFSGNENYGGIEDDHVPFLQRGVDIVHLISSPYPSVWHDPTDDWAHLDFDLIDDFCRIFRVFIATLMQIQPDTTSCSTK